MKAKFILEFIDELAAIGTDIFQAWANTPYKGFRMRNTYPRPFRQGISDLRRRKLLLQNKNGSFHFSDTGKVWFRKTLIKYHRSIGTKWDGKWRIAMFDIPHKLEKQRYILRSKLKSMGFQMLQKSVFVIPYPCEEELAHTCQQLKLSDYIEVLETKNIGSREKEFRKIFAI